jgi:hypothetical protein
MKRLSLGCALVSCVILWTGALNAFAQGVNQWLAQQAHVQDTAEATAAKKKPTQSQSISIDHGSTTFVDQSSAADLVGTALNLVPLGGSQDGSGTMTASLYSLYALGKQQDPLKPSIYNAHSGMRKLFFTLGREEQNSDSQDATTRGTVYGVRWLPVNRRDASSIAADKDAMKQIQDIATIVTGAAAAVTSRLQTLLYERFGAGRSISAFLTSLTTADSVQALVDQLTPAERAQVDDIVKAYRDRMGVANSQLKKLVETLSRRWQFALDFQTTQRPKAAPDDYRVQIILDRAFTNRLFFAFNGSYEYSNSQKIGGDTRSGRGAVELRYNMTEVGGWTLRTPVQLALSGEGLRKQDQWQYRAQVQVSIPISTGINLPLSFGYGNRPELLRQQEKDVYGKFGLTFDFGKIVDALRSNL